MSARLPAPEGRLNRRLIELLQSREKSCGPRPDLLERAVATTGHVQGYPDDSKLVEGTMQVALSYDNVDLIVTINYRGALLIQPNSGLRSHVLLEEVTFNFGLADFLIGIYPDHMESSARGSAVNIRLIFSI